MTVTTKAVLQRTREILSDPDVWWHPKADRVVVADKQSLCLMQAVGEAYRGLNGDIKPDWEATPILDSFAVLKKAVNYPESSSLLYFNDHHDRTHDQVLAALDDAIEMTP